MTCGFRQMLLLVGLLWWARLGRRLSITRLLFTLLWIAGLLFALLRIAWLLLLTLTITRWLMAIACSCGTWPVISSLSLRLAWRALGFFGNIGWRHKAVYRNYRNLAFNQSLDVSEKL